MDPFVGEIRAFANAMYLPPGWLPCEGQTLPIQQYTVLYAVLQGQYGQDSASTFKLPDLRGAAAMGAGSGPGLTPRVIAGTGGEVAVTLLETQIPSHNHVPNCQADAANATTANGTVWANGAVGGRGGASQKLYVPAPDGSTFMHPAAVLPTGGGLPHDNVQPALALRLAIAFEGTFPVRD